MSESLVVQPETIVTGWDFSTSAVKCLAFDLDGQVVAEDRLPTDLWTEGGVSELNLMQMEGQTHASVRRIAARLKELGRLQDWRAGGISATHHTSGRIDASHVQVRRAICWNDQTLGKYHQTGVERIGGEQRVDELIHGAWAPRYTLSHLVKDAELLPEEQWKQTHRILSHGSLAAGYLTGNFDVTSVSSAASTGIMNLRDQQWCRDMLRAIGRSDYEELAWQQLPRIVSHDEPVGRVKIALADEFGLSLDACPLIFPTSDDQAAGLVGAGAVDSGQLAIILGTSAVVNSASQNVPAASKLDVMRLNWGPYLWMRCYTNGAQFIEHVVGKSPDWERLESLATACSAAETLLNPFVFSEPSLGVAEPSFGWIDAEPSEPGQRFRAALEALAYLVVLGVREHELAGQTASRITVSGGTSQSQLMCEILATLLDRPLERLQSSEGPAQGAAVTALASYERLLRRQSDRAEPFLMDDAVQRLVNFAEPVLPKPEWKDTYARGLARFEREVLKR